MPSGATHLLLFVECGRGEGNMLFLLDRTVQQVIVEIANFYEYDLHNGDIYNLMWGRDVLPADLPLYETLLVPNSHVRLVAIEPKRPK